MKEPSPRLPEKKNFIDDLGQLLTECNMQVTVTGWKAELEKCEAILSASQAREQKLREALEHIAKYEPTKGMVKIMPLRAIEEINKIAREALSGSGDQGK